MSSQIDIDIGKRISLVFHDIGESQVAFAKNIGTSQSFLSKILRGESKPSADILEGIAKAYRNIDPEWLLTGEGEMHRDANGQRATSGEKDPAAGLEQRRAAVLGLMEKLPPDEQDALLREWQQTINARQEFAEIRRELAELKRKAG